MNKAVAEKFCDDLGLTERQIEAYEALFDRDFLPILRRHRLSNLVITIEELINERRRKETLLESKRRLNDNNRAYDDTVLEKTVNRKMFRLFSIMLVPVGSRKLKVRTYLFKRGALITYWKDLPEYQTRMLVAHELGHIVTKYLFDNTDPSSTEALAILFGYLGLQDRNNYYINKTTDFTRKYDMEIYDELVNLCKRKEM